MNLVAYRSLPQSIPMRVHSHDHLPLTRLLGVSPTHPPQAGNSGATSVCTHARMRVPDSQARAGEEGILQKLRPVGERQREYERKNELEGERQALRARAREEEKERERERAKLAGRRVMHTESSKEQQQRLWVEREQERDRAREALMREMEWTEEMAVEAQRALKLLDLAEDVSAAFGARNRLEAARAQVFFRI
jgi:hypothetical protein